MRWIYLAVIILFAAATIVFVLQNFEIVTMSFLGINARVPLALLVAVAYLLGAATGGSLFALLRRSYEGIEKRRGLVDLVPFRLRPEDDEGRDGARAGRARLARRIRMGFAPTTFPAACRCYSLPVSETRPTPDGLW